MKLLSKVIYMLSRVGKILCLFGALACIVSSIFLIVIGTKSEYSDEGVLSLCPIFSKVKGVFSLFMLTNNFSKCSNEKNNKTK